MGATLPRETRTQFEIRAWELRGLHWTHERIGRELGVSKQAVGAMLRRVERRELARLSATVELVKARQTAQLETVASEAYEAWLQSKERRVVERIAVDPKDGAGDGASGVMDTPSIRETRTHQCDSSLLNQVRGALADIRAIWGIEAPNRFEATARVEPFHVVIVDSPGDL